MCLSTSSVPVCCVKLFVRTTLLAFASFSSSSLGLWVSSVHIKTEDHLLLVWFGTWSETTSFCPLFRLLLLLLRVAFTELIDVDAFSSSSQFPEFNEVSHAGVSDLLITVMSTDRPTNTRGPTLSLPHRPEPPLPL